jgi:hypothetical protein
LLVAGNHNVGALNRERRDVAAVRAVFETKFSDDHGRVLSIVGCWWNQLRVARSHRQVFSITDTNHSYWLRRCAKYSAAEDAADPVGLDDAVVHTAKRRRGIRPFA